MGTNQNRKIVELRDSMFNLDDPMSSGAWFWWFCSFFFENPKNPKKPREVVIVWTTKNVEGVDEDGIGIVFKRKDDNGAVASWYFDGEKMRHNIVLEKCKIRLARDRLSSESMTPTSYSVGKEGCRIKIGDDFEFFAKPLKRNKLASPRYHLTKVFGKNGISGIEAKKLEVKGVVEGEPITGTAYFQKVFANVPLFPWNWGVFHFENEGILTYNNHTVLWHVGGKDISFFDGKDYHNFTDMDVRISKGRYPKFEVVGENQKEKMSFTAKAYAHSSWVFKEKIFGFMGNQLTYNEYPAIVTDLKLVNKKNGKETNLKQLGKNMGNIEHGTGSLI